MRTLSRAWLSASRSLERIDKRRNLQLLLVPFSGRAVKADCTAINGAERVKLVVGRCEVTQCEPDRAL